MDGDFVQEYQGDNLAENSEDEKRIKRAFFKKSVSQSRETRKKDKFKKYFSRTLCVNLY